MNAVYVYQPILDPINMLPALHYAVRTVCFAVWEDHFALSALLNTESANSKQNHHIIMLLQA